MKLYFFVLFSILLISCKENVSTQPKIIVYYGCNNVEIVQDIEISIINNQKWFEEAGIIVEENTIEKKCGYTFIYNTKKKEVKSSQTDIDLLFLVKDFFKI